MKEGRKLEYPKKTPDDKLQKMPHTTTWKCQPQPRLGPALEHWWQVRKADMLTITSCVIPNLWCCHMTNHSLLTILFFQQCVIGQFTTSCPFSPSVNLRWCYRTNSSLLATPLFQWCFRQTAVSFHPLLQWWCYRTTNHLLSLHTFCDDVTGQLIISCPSLHTFSDDTTGQLIISCPSTSSVIML